MADSEYRLNFVIRILGEFAWYTAQLSVFEVLYLHTQVLNGWGIQDVRVFMGTLFLVDSLYMILFLENLDAVSSMVRKGDLDLLLTKPVNSQFMISCRKVAAVHVVNLVLVTGYLVWGISNLKSIPHWNQFVAYGMMVIAGLAILYSFRLLFSMASVILIEATNVQFVWYQIYKLAMRPDVIYPKILRLLILTALPVGFIASVPSRMLVEGINFKLASTGLGIAALMILFTSYLWRRALVHYSSASS